MQSPLLFPTKGDTLIIILHIFHPMPCLKKPCWKITSNFDFKEFWFDARERERANSIMSKGWKMLLMNFCELDKYLPVQTVIIFVPIFYTKGLLINMFNILLVLWGLCGRLENVFDIVSARYNVTNVADTLLPGFPT